MCGVRSVTSPSSQVYPRLRYDRGQDARVGPRECFEGLPLAEDIEGRFLAELQGLEHAHWLDHRDDLRLQITSAT
jgi:hypothetical protein